MKNVIEFEEELNISNSYSSVNLGKYYNRMELKLNKGGYSGYIIWNFGKKAADEDEEIIGVWFNANSELTDYDGVFELPKEAIQLLKNNGYTLDENLKETYPD